MMPFQVHIHAQDCANFRITVVWTDPAGSIGGKTVLQNDLDVSVVVPGSDNGTRDAVNKKKKRQYHNMYWSYIV
jgi:hypothetical protein